MSALGILSSRHLALYLPRVDELRARPAVALAKNSTRSLGTEASPLPQTCADESWEELLTSPATSNGSASTRWPVGGAQRLRTNKGKRVMEVNISSGVV